MNTIFATALEKLLNQALRLDTNSFQPLNRLAGKSVNVELTGLSLTFTFFPETEGIAVLGNYAGETDAYIQSPPFTLLNLLLNNQSTFNNYTDVIVSGDINVAQQLLQILQGLDIDWEEQLAQRLGDVPAHSLGTLMRRGQHYVNDQLTNLQYYLSEYLQEEARHLPAPAEIEVFLNGVDILREDVERLEQRVRNLRKRFDS